MVQTEGLYEGFSFPLTLTFPSQAFVMDSQLGGQAIILGGNLGYLHFYAFFTAPSCK